MRLSISGFNLPGRAFCRPDGTLMSNVHVGVQVGREPVELVRADAPSAHWQLDIDVVMRDGQIDFRGSAIDTGRLLARVDLTGGDGGPRCARVDPPAIEWSG